MRFCSGSGSVLAADSRFGSRFSKNGSRTGLNRTSATLTPTRVPWPPSASNFLNQNNFSPSQPFHYDIPPHFNRHHSHRPQTHNSRAYSYPTQLQHHPPYAQPGFYPFPPFYPPYYNMPHPSLFLNYQQNQQQPQLQQQQYPSSPPIITA